MSRAISFSAVVVKEYPLSVRSLIIHCQISASKIKSLHCVRQTITFKYWYRVRYSITAIKYNPSSSSRGIERQHRLDRDIHCRRIESLEHYLCHFFTVGFWVQWCFRQENVMFLRGNSQFVVKCMVPNLFHIFPASYNTMTDWILKYQNSSLCLCLFSDVGIFLSHSNHYACMFRPTHNRRKNSSWGIISCKPCLYHARTVINYKGCNFFFVHLCR